MSYTTSLATTGLGTTISINTSTTTTPTYTAIGEIVSAPQSGRVSKTSDVTNFESTAVEFIATLVDSGNFEFTYNRVSTDAGQLALEATFETLKKVLFKIVLPLSGTQTVSGDTYTFTALIEELTSMQELAPDKAIRSRARLKVSGIITFTAGT